MRKVVSITVAAVAVLTWSAPSMAETGYPAGQVPATRVSGLSLARVTLPRTHLPHLTPDALVVSSNWSGYAAVAKKNVRLRYVATTFTIPRVNCARSKPGTAGVAYASNWVGLDGFNDKSVEQIGVDSYCDSARTARYDAWYEMYPLRPVVYANVNPGDAISVSVYLKGSKYKLSLTDLTTGGSLRTSQPCPSHSTCRDASAEVITEDPGSAEPVINLADFGLVNFTRTTVTSLDGKRGTLARNSLWTSSKILMKDSRNKVMAQPSSLEGGRAFTVAWRAAQ
jgi:Peptidase A4 family